MTDFKNQSQNPFLRYSFTTTRLDVESATTLNPNTYRNEHLYHPEQEKIFEKSWVCVGYVSQLEKPGQILRAQINNQPIVITKNKKNQLRAFYNVCRHRGSILVLNDKKIERFRCPYHSWTYDLDGNLKNCPLFEPKEKNSTFKKNDYALFPVRVQSYGCFIFVNLSNDAEPLSDYLGDMPQSYKNFPLNELKLVRRKGYAINANWKLIAENFLEYYHLPWVHPELCAVSPVDMHKRNQGRGMYTSFYAHPLGASGSALDADKAPIMPGLNEFEKKSGYFPFVFPNLAIFLLPHHMFSLIMSPNSINTTNEYGDLLVHESFFEDKNAEKKLDAIFEFYDMVNKQDIEAVERVQKGIYSKAYQGGRMSYRFEEPVHRFQNMVIDFLTGDRREYPADK